MTDTRPDWLKDAQADGTDVQWLGVDGIPYDYTVVKAGLEPALPYTVSFRNGILFISEDVPELYRHHILAHEVFEETILLSTLREERCLLSLMRELEEVQADPAIDFAEYLRDRSLFFDALVTYYEERPEQLAARGPGFLESIKKSQRFLRSLV